MPVKVKQRQKVGAQTDYLEHSCNKKIKIDPKIETFNKF